MSFWPTGLRIRLFNFSLKILTCALYILRVSLDNPNFNASPWAWWVLLFYTVYYSTNHFIIIIRHDFALNIKIVFLFCCCWPLQHFKCVHIFAYLFIIRYGSLLCPRSSACRNNTGVNATDSSKINWYVSFRKPLQDGWKIFCLCVAITCKCIFFFMVYRELIFWVNRRDPLWAIQVSDSAFSGREHKSNSTAMLNLVLNVHITWEAFIGSNITELCGSPGRLSSPKWWNCCC